MKQAHIENGWKIHIIWKKRGNFMGKVIKTTRFNGDADKINYYKTILYFWTFFSGCDSKIFQGYIFRGIWANRLGISIIISYQLITFSVESFLRSLPSSWPVRALHRRSWPSFRRRLACPLLASACSPFHASVLDRWLSFWK